MNTGNNNILNTQTQGWKDMREVIKLYDDLLGYIDKRHSNSGSDFLADEVEELVASWTKIRAEIIRFVNAPLNK
jgi:hypothetical protein